MDNKKFEEMKNAVGLIAEMSLLFFRAELSAGATPEEAWKLTQAYIAACMFGGNQPED